MAKNDTKITRIKAGGKTKDKAVKSTKQSGAQKPRFKRAKAEKKMGYFKGAWHEIKQVRWPTRSATWGLTGAVLAFSAFFVVFILLLDAFFKYIFELIFK